MDDFLDRCAEADPETAALLMALYNEGVREANEVNYEAPNGHWFDLSETGW